MNVLHLNSNYLYTTLHEQLINSLEGQGVNNKIFMPHNGNRNFRVSIKNNVIEQKVFNKNDRFFFILKQKKIFRYFNENMSMDDVDIIHAHTLFTDGYLAYQLNKKYNTPYIIAVRNTDINYFFKYKVHLRKTGISILKNAQKIIFLSKSYQSKLIDKYTPKQLKNNFQDKSIILPNGINSYWLNNKGKAREKPESKINILYAGTINKNKNIITSTKAIENLISDGYNVKYTVVGNIKDQSLQKTLDKKSFVKVLDQVGQEELREIYNQNDIFLMPSHNETFGLVYAEAMSQGLPVIYTRNQGFDKQFDEGEVGYSVISSSSLGIKKSILNIVENYQILSENSLNKVDRFNWNDISKEYVKLYQTIFNK